MVRVTFTPEAITSFRRLPISVKRAFDELLLRFERSERLRVASLWPVCRLEGSIDLWIVKVGRCRGIFRWDGAELRFVRLSERGRVYQRLPKWVRSGLPFRRGGPNQNRAQSLCEERASSGHSDFSSIDRTVEVPLIRTWRPRRPATLSSTIDPRPMVDPFHEYGARDRLQQSQQPKVTDPQLALVRGHEPLEVPVGIQRRLVELANDSPGYGRVDSRQVSGGRIGPKDGPSLQRPSRRLISR
jgi:hypothetical protein